MPALPEKVSLAWDQRQGPIVLTTVGKTGVPNSIYATCVSKFSEDTIVVANNYFSKTMSNILAGNKGAILFITPEDEAYQIKGKLEYYEEGDIFEDMKKWNKANLPGLGAVALKVEQVYAGADQLL